MSRAEMGDLRYYEKKIPAKGDLVIIQITSVTEMGAYCTLTEYNSITGFLPSSEYSKRRIRSVRKIVRVGKRDVASVLRVDSEKKYIDLSKKKVTPEEVQLCEKRFFSNRKVHQIICHLAKKHSVKVDYLNERITWPLEHKYPTALDGFKNPMFLEETVHQLDLEETIKESLIQDLKVRLAPQPLKMKVEIKIQCHGPKGIDGIKTAFAEAKKAIDKINPNNDVSMKVKATPYYIISVSCPDVATGETLLNAAVTTAIKSISAFEGGFGAASEEGFIIIGGDDQHDKAESSEESEDDEESENDDESENDEDDEESEDYDNDEDDGSENDNESQGDDSLKKKVDQKDRNDSKH